MMFERVYGPSQRPRTLLPAHTLISLGVHATALAIVTYTGARAAGITEAMNGGIIFFAPTPASAAGPVGVERITFTALPGDEGDALEKGIADGATATPVETGRAIPKGGEEAGARGQPETVDAGAFEIPADSIYLASQVDNPVAYDARSAAPAYPDSLRRSGVEGQVTAQFVVDTTGRVDLDSFVLLESTHGRFTESVREALPRMLFRPAEINGYKIKQLVQIPFVFKITAIDTIGPDTVRTEGAQQLVRRP